MSNAKCRMTTQVDSVFVIRHLLQAEGVGVEPTRPLRVARFSKPARRTVSGYLPFEWSVGESNPDFLDANQVSSRWTNVPSRPRQHLRRSRIIQFRSTNALQVTKVGVEPTNTRLSTRSLCQFAYLVVLLTSDLRPPTSSKWRVRESHPAVQAYEARLSAGSPAIPRGSAEGGRGKVRRMLPFPLSPSAFHLSSSSQGEIRTPMPLRARRSERRVYPSSTTWLKPGYRRPAFGDRQEYSSWFLAESRWPTADSPSSDPCGNRTRVASLRDSGHRLAWKPVGRCH
jgi:hypothetical protein